MKIVKLLLVAALITFSVSTFAQTGISKGDTAPLFRAIDNTGEKVDLAAILKTHKAVVLFFYRGQWCPYCNKQMQHIQDSLKYLTEKGAYVLGITPETAENIQKTVEKTHASYALVQDKGYRIMKDYKVDFVVDESTAARLKGYGIDLEKNNGNTDHVLPVPATYVIDHSGKIIFVHFDKDYRKRATVADVLKAI
jgi:peroxiredoxin